MKVREMTERAPHGTGMERVNRIWNHRVYQECLEKICAYEQEREFCRHTPEHFLDVARLTYILALEAGLLTGGTKAEKADKTAGEGGSAESGSLERETGRELIYAAGLLHDIGRHLQYEQGIPHEKASAEIAEEILLDCGFEKEEREQILGLILSHRTRGEDGSLKALFYRADKFSRNCFACPAQEACDWPAEKKNLEIRL